MSHLVLVVDDDESMCELLAEGLDPAKFEVVWTTDPCAAEELLQRRTFDVVLTDVRLGRLNGFELCSRLVQRHRGLPVVVMTAFGSIDAAVHAMRAGAYDFLTKPLDVDLTGVTLERAIGHGALHREVSELRREVAAARRHGDTELAVAEPAELLSLEEIERRYILRVFEAVRGNKSQAALVLGLDRKTLYRRLERYGMLRPSAEAAAPASGVR